MVGENIVLKNVIGNQRKAFGLERKTLYGVEARKRKSVKNVAIFILLIPKDRNVANTVLLSVIGSL
jgi:hypothetical protein